MDTSRSVQHAPQQGNVTVGQADQKAKLNYIRWEDEFRTEKPYEFISQAPEGCPRKNFTLAASPEQAIHDIRGSEELFNLDDHGFQIVRQELGAIPTDQEGIEKEYLPKVIDLLQNIDPGAEVVIFDWRVSEQMSIVKCASEPAVFTRKQPLTIADPPTQAPDE